MNKYGVKLYKSDINKENKKIVDEVLKNGGTLELAMYYEIITSEDINYLELFKISPKKIIYHANYNKFDITSYFKTTKRDEKIKDFIEEVKNAKYFNASRMVLHLEKEPFDMSSENKINYHIKNTKEVFKRLYKEYPKAKEITIMIENTFSTLNFYKRVVNELVKDKYNVGFTLDIGHAKVWSNNTLTEWLGLTKEMVTEGGIPIHFHLHTNKGDCDTHTPFYKVQSLKEMNQRINDKDNPFSKNLIKEIKDIQMFFKNEELVTITLETNITDAIKDYELLVK